MSRGSRDGYRNGYPDIDYRRSRGQGYEMGRRQKYEDPGGYPSYDDYDRHRGRPYDGYDGDRGRPYDDYGGHRMKGHHNKGYHADEEPRVRAAREDDRDYDDIDDPKKAKKGKKKPEYDPSRKGPIKNRSCTDVICCIVFIIFILGLAVVAYFGYAYGNPAALIYPVNSDGETCGFGKHKGKPYLFYFDLIQCARLGPGVLVNGCPTPQICVKDCPTENFVFLQALVDPRTASNMICKDGVKPSSCSEDRGCLKNLIMDHKCAPYTLNSTAIADRCLPIAGLVDATKSVAEVVTKNNVKQTLNTLGGTVNGSTFSKTIEVFNKFLEAKELGEKVITDVQSSWWMILVALGLACLVSLIWIVLMRWIAGVMVWVTVIAFVFLWAGAAAYSIYMYIQTKGSGDQYVFLLAVVQLSFEKEKLYLGLGIAAAIVFLIVFLIFLFLIQRIRIAIALIEEGSRAIGNMLFTLIWPVFPFLLQIVVIGFYLTLAVFLASIGRNQILQTANITDGNGTIIKPLQQTLLDQICDFQELGKNNDSLGTFCTEARYNGGSYTIYLQIYNLFMLFWLVNFVTAFGQMTLAGAFASYYWAFNKKKDIPTFPLLGSAWRTLRYHLGTLAFGSLIIAIVQLIRVALEYVDQKLKGTENPVGKFFIKCLKCCFWCLEKFLKFLNKNVYILTAVYGRNFCSAARKAFSLILRNCVRVVVVDNVTDFLLFVAKLVVVGAVGVASYFFFDGRIPFLRAYTPVLNFYVVPIIIVVLATYVIAACFFSVYEMAVDTLFLCFLMDLDKNDGSPEKPYFMSKNLKKILGKKNKPPPSEEEPRGKSSRK